MQFMAIIGLIIGFFALIGVLVGLCVEVHDWWDVLESYDDD